MSSTFDLVKAIQNIYSLTDSDMSKYNQGFNTNCSIGGKFPSKEKLYFG